MLLLLLSTTFLCSNTTLEAFGAVEEGQRVGALGPETVPTNQVASFSDPRIGEVARRFPTSTGKCLGRTERGCEV